jgi:hypothetical protein
MIAASAPRQLPARRTAGTLCLCWLLVTAGCGTSEYDRRRAEWLRSYRAVAARRAAAETQARLLQQFYGPTELSGTSLRIRVPKVFTTAFDSNSKVAGQPIDSRRLHPPFLTLPGFRLCYESTAAGNQGQLPFYLYLAVVDRQYAPPGETSLAEWIQKKFAAAFPDARAAWEPFEVESVAGEKVTWRKIAAAGTQPFYVLQPGQATYVDLPGIVELYTVEQGPHLVIVACRYPTEIQDRTDLGRTMPVVLATLERK